MCQRNSTSNDKVVVVLQRGRGDFAGCDERRGRLLSQDQWGTVENAESNTMSN